MLESNLAPWQMMLAESRSHICESLSPKLFAEVSWEVNRAWLSKIPFLNLDNEEEAHRRSSLRIRRPIVPMQHVRTRISQVCGPWGSSPLRIEWPSSALPSLFSTPSPLTPLLP